MTVGNVKDFVDHRQHLANMSWMNFNPMKRFINWINTVK